MGEGRARVLLVGADAGGSSILTRLLEERGCHCWFATTFREAAELFGQQVFDLVLSTAPLHQGDPFNGLVEDSHGSFFYSYPVEDGCWWLLVVRRGEKCLGGAALRPSEFIEVLDKVISEIATDAVAAAPQGGSP